MVSDFLSSDILSQVWHLITKVVPYFLPFILGYIAWKSWMEYINTQYLQNLKWITLQVVLPKEVSKTPLAMEVILQSAFYQTGGTGTWWAKYVQGKLRVYFSLEIASIDGNVYFFIRTTAMYKNLIESQIYAQYPNTEIVEVDDYTEQIPHDPHESGWKMWGGEYTLAKDDMYPIKTYVDYGLDKAPAPAMAGMTTPSSQLDPLTSLIEFMGNIKKGEQIWLQIVIRAAWDQYPDPNSWFGKVSWAKDAAARVKKLRDDLRGKPEEGVPPKMLTKGEQDALSAIEKSITKYGFDVGIRSLYMAEKNTFNPINVVGLVGIFKQYGSHDLNSFKPTNTIDYNYPWQDPSGRKERRNARMLLHAYREREFFYIPWSASFSSAHKHPHTFVLNTEELATIFHFPGRVSETPTFKRIDSKKGEPPANLPI